MSDGESTDGSAIGSVGSGVSLSESRSGTVSEGVESRGVGGIGIALGERVVGVADSQIRSENHSADNSLSWHDPIASHLVEGVLTLLRSRNSRILSDTNTKTELLEGHVANGSVRWSLSERANNSLHPLLVRNVGTGRIGGNVTADGVTVTGSTVGVELSSCIARGDVKLGQISKTLDLPVQGGLDKVNGSKGSVGDDTSVVTGF